MDIKLKKRFNKLKTFKGQKYYKERRKFITLALGMRYTYREIGEWFGVTRQTIHEAVNG